MNILWLKTELLHPIDKGGKIRTYQTLRYLKERHHVTYLCLDDGQAALDAEARASEYCHDLVRVPFAAPRRGSVAFFADLARNVFSSLPYAIAKYRSEAMRRAIRAAVRERKIDLIVCDFLFPSLNLDDGLGVPLVLFQHNVEASIWERHAATASSAIKRWYMSAQWRRMKAWERRECLRVDHVIAVSEDDARAMATQYGVEHVTQVPTGVDTDYFSPDDSVQRRATDIVFLGSMDWMPNEDGVSWFASEVLGRIRQSLPEVRFRIVGRSPSRGVRALAERDPRIEVTGTVPDVRPYLASAGLLVVPLRIGGGTRIKIYEGMASGCAVVSTTIGAEGLPVRDGVELAVADSPEDFARRCIELLRDEAARERLGRAAAARVRRDFGWQRSAEQFAADCEAVLHRAHEGPRASAVLTRR